MGRTLRNKLLINGILLVTSAISLIFFSTIFLKTEALDRIGYAWSTRFERSLTTEAKLALATANETGSLSPLVDLLESSRWRNLVRNDRGYPLKRKVLAKVCELQLASAQYESMERTARSWASIDERDIDAQAYLYESLRQQPDFYREGIQGLENLLIRFPGHMLSGTFLTRHYSDIGDEESSRSTRRGVLQAAASVLSRWRVYWITTSDHQYHPARSAFIYLSAAEQGVTAELYVPNNITFLRIDPPTNSQFQINSLAIRTGEDALSFDLSKLDVNEMQRYQGQLISVAAIDPFFTAPIILSGNTASPKSKRIRLDLGVDILFDGKRFPLAEFLTPTS